MSIDMSLRLWSAAAELDGIVAELDLPVGHRHRLGFPMAVRGPLAARIAERHYVQLDAQRSPDSREVEAWLRRVLMRVEASVPLKASLASADIEGTVWIAVLGGEPQPEPELGQAELAAARRLGLSVLVENYTLPEPAEVPGKTWLVQVARPTGATPPSPAGGA